MLVQYKTQAREKPGGAMSTPDIDIVEWRGGVMLAVMIGCHQRIVDIGLVFIAVSRHMLSTLFLVTSQSHCGAGKGCVSGWGIVML